MVDSLLAESLMADSLLAESLMVDSVLVLALVLVSVAETLAAELVSVVAFVASSARFAEGSLAVAAKLKLHADVLLQQLQVAVATS